MEKRVWLLGVVAIMVVSLSGCSSSRKKDLEIQGLRNQVSAFETQMPAKTEETTTTEQVVTKTTEETVGNPAKVADEKQIQTALKNAGYFNGTIDGKLGKKTRRAVRAFQKANNLSVDGKVGKNTWAILKDYLDKKVK